MSDRSQPASRPWLKHQDYWVRQHLSYPGRPLGEILDSTAVELPDKVATHFLGAELTYFDLKRRSDALADGLARLGIVKGDRVAIMLPNCPQYIIAAFAILRLGAVVVNINPSYTPREFSIVAVDSGAKAIITLDALAPLVLGVRHPTMEHVVVTSLAEYAKQAAEPPQIADTIGMAQLIVESGVRHQGADPGVRHQIDVPTTWRFCNTRAGRRGRQRARC